MSGNVIPGQEGDRALTGARRDMNGDVTSGKLIGTGAPTPMTASSPVRQGPTLNGETLQTNPTNSPFPRSRMTTGDPTVTFKSREERAAAMPPAQIQRPVAAAPPTMQGPTRNGETLDANPKNSPLMSRAQALQKVADAGTVQRQQNGATGGVIFGARTATPELLSVYGTGSARNAHDGIQRGPASLNPTANNADTAIPTGRPRIPLGPASLNPTATNQATAIPTGAGAPPSPQAPAVAGGQAPSSGPIAPQPTFPTRPVLPSQPPMAGGPRSVLSADAPKDHQGTKGFGDAFVKGNLSQAGNWAVQNTGAGIRGLVGAVAPHVSGSGFDGEDVGKKLRRFAAPPSQEELRARRGKVTKAAAQQVGERLRQFPLRTAL